ncbi:ATP-binding protein [Azotobacter chroococcum]|uniref:ATP-binding protein n=1 Tax=Azotobacter chroococcum TaxID=353 RepID=UPI0010AE84AF|nr:ATP-binding protein [Azotobacter chroococcum]TKD47386.1 ATP-binding protein [Azotobacter chroococcum]
MNSFDPESANQAFLQAGVRWIRALLEDCLAASTPPAKKRPWPWSKALVPQAAKAAEPARAEFDKVVAANPDIPFNTLTRQFGLSPLERNMLLLACSVEIDSGIPYLMAQVQGDSGKRYPTFALGMSLFIEERAWDALSPERPLRAQRLLEVHQSGAVSLLAAPLRIDERIAAYMKGFNYLDERLAALVRPLPDLDPLPPSQEALAEVLGHWFMHEESQGLVQLSGPHGSSKADVVARAATLAGKQALTLQADALPVAGDELETFERLWSREARLLPLVLLIQGVEGVEPLAGEDGRPSMRPRWPRVLARIGAPCLLDVRQPLPELDTAPVLAIAPPTDRERRKLWQDSLTVEDAVPDEWAVTRLAGEFRLSATQLYTIAHRARTSVNGDGDDETPTFDAGVGHAWRECVQHAGAALTGITRWVAPRATVDEVKLPALEREQLERLIAHARHRSVVASEFGFVERSERGLGLTALFHGESGTGKTFAAEAVANALGLGLAVIDVASAISKYIGETPKNLRRCFDAAEAGGTMLFFDEADALFGKRGEVKDSHDRYANTEINYLLMRMETFSGVAILATNQKHALDPAFMRRLRFVVGFPFPGVAERKAIWESVFPAQTPVGELDYDRLARFQLSGGNIFNAALAAAHGAVADGSRVEMLHVLDAVRWELRKLERPVAEAEFRWQAGNTPMTEVSA